eukprot:TRINITY_DN3406_c0_g1_i7.p1 TRINITY_DN3406_c0_g1~~TRINITY_DN3406_c0_g1_i7.p1  ORF type:complete len:357 (-),score=23.64 TRINITY_DN3406_c0_g1_i7:32-1102(-)
MKSLWLSTTPQHIMTSQRKLLKHFVKIPLTERRVELKSGEYINMVDTWNGQGSAPSKTLVLTHGYGSGLGFWFRNIDALTKEGGGKYDRVIAVDWLGMGASSRPSNTKLPLRRNCGKTSDPQEFIQFFVSSLEEGLGNIGLQKFHLLGHSFGGYIGAHYALQHPNQIEKLILASAVGIPAPSEGYLQRSEMKTQYKLIDSLWKANFTPQSILRFMGPRGKRIAQNIVRGRFQNRWNDEETNLISEYLYHITCETPSGEYALNALLEPRIYPAGVSRTGVYARIPLYPKLVDPTIYKTKTQLLFGDTDWMYHPQMKELVDERSIHDNHMELAIISSAGHHLYLDNTTEFHARINSSE